MTVPIRFTDAPIHRVPPFQLFMRPRNETESTSRYVPWTARVQISSILLHADAPSTSLRSRCAKQV